MEESLEQAADNENDEIIDSGHRGTVGPLDPMGKNKGKGGVHDRLAKGKEGTLNGEKRLAERKVGRALGHWRQQRMEKWVC